MPMTASQLRQNIYRLLDEVLESGKPLIIERKGKTLKIVPESPRGKLENLSRRDEYFQEDPETLVEVDWSAEWQP